MSLRRQAMDHRKHEEGGKTMSRKAKARLNADFSPLRSVQNSRANSRAPSNDGSRPGSRHASLPGSRVGSRLPSPSHSPTRDSDFAYETTENSLSDEDDESSGVDKLIHDMKDRTFLKGASEDRLRIIRTFANTICRSPDDHPQNLAEAFPVLVRCLTKDSADVARHASRAIAAMAIFSGIPNIFAAVNLSLQTSMSATVSMEAKEAAINSYSVIAYFGGADGPEVNGAMGFLLEIIKSDGDVINAIDNAEVVCAAMNGWAFLSTLTDPDELAYYDALEAFEDQLQSSIPSVLMTAADCIGLVAEEQYGPADFDQYGNALSTSDDISEGDDEHVEGALSKQYRKATWTQHYDIFQDRTQPLKSRLSEVASSSMRKAKKDVRKEIHSVLRDVLHAVDYPWRGPRFSVVRGGSCTSTLSRVFANGKDPEDSRMLGHRLTKSGILIDRWWKLHRYNAIRQIVQGGMQDYIDHCPIVRQALSGDSVVAPSKFKMIDEPETDELVQNTPQWPVDSGSDIH